MPEIEVVPGIPALSACAAKLGAPLMHDFASISLSDLLTPWELIEKRIEAAAAERDNEEIIITDLKDMLDNEIDMQSTVIIGNSQTFAWKTRMITPRGYTSKYEFGVME